MQKTDTTDKETETGTGSRSLGLTVPAQTPPPEGNLFLAPEEISAWIAALPLANIGETSRQVYHRLSEFNQYAIPSMLRTKGTELFRPIVAYIYDNLHRHFMDRGFPLSQKAWKTLILSRELNNELALSYKIVIEDLLRGNKKRLDKRLLIIALHHALYYLSQVYLQTCLSYTSPPPGLWKEINALFAFARRNRLQRVQVKMKSGDSEEKFTLEERYKALMLFASATPSHLAQTHLEPTFQKTLEWAASTGFLAPQDADSDKDILNINLLRDEPPVHNALRKPTSHRHVAVLDVAKLIAKLEQEYQQTPVDGSKQVKLDTDRLPRSLLGQLIRSWDFPSERRLQRTQLNFSLRIFSGFREIHAKLAGQKESPGSLQDASGAGPDPDRCELTLLQTPGGDAAGLVDKDAFSANLAPPTNRHGHSEWMTDYGASNGSLAAPGGFPELDFNPASDSTGEAPGRTVTTTNESAVGYCIKWSAGEQAPKTRVGELVGIGSEDMQAGISLGVVRWLRCINQTELEAGLQIIPGAVKAVQAYQAIAEGKIPLRNRHNPIKCLFLPAPPTGQDRKEGPSLVLASMTLPVGTCLWLEDAQTSSEPQLVRLARVLDFSGTFARYGLEYIGKDDADAENDRTEFENLWKSL